MEDTLITVRNYATKMGITTAWVYKLIAAGKVKSKIIDGVKFVVWEGKKNT
jgi:predicted DNA-binding transcriptional regulator AlpA